MTFYGMHSSFINGVIIKENEQFSICDKNAFLQNILRHTSVNKRHERSQSGKWSEKNTVKKEKFYQYLLIENTSKYIKIFQTQIFLKNTGFKHLF